MTREIPLSTGGVSLVDDEDFDHLSQFAWRISRRYAVRTVGSHRKGTLTHIWMHRVILDAPDGLEVDHINRDPLDNRRGNLRLCSHAENARNRTYTRKEPGFKGTARQGAQWRAMLAIDGKQVQLGTFDTQIEAAIAYDLGAKEHFGEFANLNFSPERDWLLPYDVRLGETVRQRRVRLGAAR